MRENLFGRARLANHADIRQHVFAWPHTVPLFRVDFDLPSTPPAKKVRGQRRLQPTVILFTQVALNQHTIFKLAVRLVDGGEIVFLADRRNRTHVRTIPPAATAYSPTS